MTLVEKRLESVHKPDESSKTEASLHNNSCQKKVSTAKPESSAGSRCQRIESQVLNISYKILDKSQTRSISHFYKSLLRRFRDFIKTHFETTYVKRSTSQHWDDETLYRKVGNYMRDKLGIPDNLTTQEDVYKMICLTKPARGRKLGVDSQNET